MYQFSRAIYREVARDINDGCHEEVLRACERCVERLAADREHFARPVRTLFGDIRLHFPVQAQARVLTIVTAYLRLADSWLAHQQRPQRCPSLTRRGEPCQREPLPHNGYCPSHQHLAPAEEPRPIAA